MQSEIEREEFRIETAPGVLLALRGVHDPASDADGRPVILIHGARVPGVPSFDLPCPGGSLASDLARSGHPAYILDLRGYGRSSRPGQSGDPARTPILTPSAEAVADIAAAVAAVSARSGGRRPALFGWATGGHWAGMFASLHPGAVTHVVIYNSLYGAERGHPLLGPGGPMSTPGAADRFDAERFGGFGLHEAASLVPSWDMSIPVEDKASWRDPGLLHAYQQAALASDPAAARRDPPAFRAPNGAMADSFALACGRPLWHAGTIEARCLLIRSENDFWSRPGDLESLARDLTAARSSRAVVLDGATHYAHLDRPEHGRDRLRAELADFLRLD